MKLEFYRLLCYNNAAFALESLILSFPTEPMTHEEQKPEKSCM